MESLTLWIAVFLQPKYQQLPCKMYILSAHITITKILINKSNQFSNGFLNG